MSDPRREAFKNFGLLCVALERLFYFLQRLSLSRLVVGGFTDATALGGSAAAQKRARRVERYIIVWTVLELLTFSFLYQLSDWLLYVALVALAYRSFEIFQTLINFNVFEHLTRRSQSKQFSAIMSRLVLLTIWNYLEIMLCFSTYYASHVARFKDFTSPIGRSAAVYFGAVTQLTIGYGDICPLAETRIIAVVQGMVGFVIALFALGRVISMLPDFDQGSAHECDARTCADAGRPPDDAQH